MSPPPMNPPESRTWIEEDDGAKATQLRLIHTHVSHFGNQFGQHPVARREKTRAGEVREYDLGGLPPPPVRPPKIPPPDPHLSKMAPTPAL